MRHRMSMSGSADFCSTGGSASGGEVELSVVIPVFNGSSTIAALVEQLHSSLAHMNSEIVLVNDGSADDSEKTCAALVQRYPGQVLLLQLTRNFGEHNAVMAGMKHACGNYLAIVDDDGQNAAEDVRRMYQHARTKNLDVVYAQYPSRAHPRLRILGSVLNDRMANLLLKKPRGLYLSSFKVMHRSVVDEVIKYNGPFPYIDGLILRVSRNIGQIEVRHLPRRAGRSGYSLSKLVGLWLNMSVGFSLAPLRLSTFAGLVTIFCASLFLAAIVVHGLWLDTHASILMPSLVAAMICAVGVQLLALGVVGEYIGRIFLHQSGMPQHVMRYVRQGDAETIAGSDTGDTSGAVGG